MIIVYQPSTFLHVRICGIETATPCVERRPIPFTLLLKRFPHIGNDPKFLFQLPSNTLVDSQNFSLFFPIYFVPTFLFVFVENTRIVAANLGCRKNNENDNSRLANSVDVLIPEVIQVVLSF